MSSTTIQIDFSALAQERREAVRLALRSLDDALYGSLVKAPPAPQATVPVVTAPAAPPRIWRVSDAHSKGIGSALVDVAIKTSSYGAYVTPNKEAKRNGTNTKITLADGTQGLVSDERYSRASGISKGDILYLADYKGKKVYRGAVLAAKTSAPFRGGSIPESFAYRLRRRAAELGKADKANEVPLAEEVEMEWSVKWEFFADLTPTLMTQLSTKTRSTVEHLSAHPTA